MKQFHEIQLTILKQLLFFDRLRFSEMVPDDMENSQFDYHLDELIKRDLVIKEDESYILTMYGKELANRINVETNEIELQTKTTTLLCAVRETENEKEILLYKRLKHPFYDCIGFPTHKVHMGDSIFETAKEGLDLETTLKGEPMLYAVRHYRIYNKQGDLLEDKLMYGFLFQDPSGIVHSSEQGLYNWVQEKVLDSFIKSPLEEFWDFYHAYQQFNGEISFQEVEKETDKF